MLHHSEWHVYIFNFLFRKGNPCLPIIESPQSSTIPNPC